MAKILMAMSICLGLVLPACGLDRDPVFGWQLGGCVDQERALTEGEGQVKDCLPENLVGEEPDYCNRILYWEYSGGSLQLVDFPVQLNCCGIRTVQYELAGDTYTITEIDQLGEFRCRCNCDTSFSVCIDNLPAVSTPIHLLLHVTDEMKFPTDVWRGDLDLGAGSGQIDLGPSGSLNCIP